MSETFFIGDTHFGHQNILTYEPIARPFATVEEMNEAIVDRWNSVVGKFDKVYHVGDFCMGGRENIAIADRLNGQKRLVMGNHDAYPAELYLKYFKSIHGVLFWNDCILTHVPVHPANLQHRSTYNIHGHLHSKRVETAGNERNKGAGLPDNTYDWRYINVSCEQNNLTPISADELFR